ncbi:MAG: hypothetical protein AAF806_27970 [Bacteroidota bacterium]
MKINAIVILFCLFCLNLSAQVDRTAITTDFMNGWTTNEKHDAIRKHFSPNMISTWQGGENWPDGSDGSLEQYWGFYTSIFKNYDIKFTELLVRELGNETYVFFNWTTTVRKDEKHPSWIGTTAEGPGAYRLVWENDKIKHLYFYGDMKSRYEQHEAQAKKK